MKHFSAILSICILGMLLCANPLLAFDEQKAKKDYNGATFKVSAIRESMYENAPAIEVAFTVPLAKKYLKNHHIALAHETDIESFILSEDRLKVIFPFVSPDKSYTVIVSGEIRDINHNKLPSQKIKVIKTRKIEPYAGFVSSGFILSASSPKRIPVSTLNIDEVDIDFFLIDRDRIPDFLDQLGRPGKNNYYQMDKIRHYGKLLHSGRFALNPKKNQRTEFNIDLDRIKSLSGPGLYAAIMRVPGRYHYQYEFTYFVRTDIGLHARRYTGCFDIYARDITTGRPIENVRLELVSKTKKKIQTRDIADTDENGRAQFHIKEGQHCIIAAKGRQFSLLQLGNSALDLSALKNARTSHSEYQIFAWGPRELYRPSETVQINMLVRDFDGRIGPDLPLHCTLINPDGSQGVSRVVQHEFKGFYRFNHKTLVSGQTGQYRLKMSFADSNQAVYTFRVEEFLPERLDLALFDGTFEKRLQKEKTQSIRVPVQSNYLYGAPASKNKVDGQITAAIDSHPFETLPEFYFGDPKEKIQYRHKKFKEIFLDQDGTGTLQMTNFWKEIKSPVRLDINASVYESGGRPVTRKNAVTLLGNDYFFGVEPQFKGKPDANTTVAVKVICVDNQGRFLKNKSFDLSLIKKDRNWYWRYNHSQGWHWEYDETPVAVFSKSVLVDDRQTVQVDLPLTWGSFRLEVADGKTMSAFEFETAWTWWGNTTRDQGQKPDLVSLAFDKNEYRPGDIANLKVTPPEDGLALVTIESSDGVLYKVYRNVESKGTPIEIRTDPSWHRHDIYASAMVIKPGDMKETPVPARAFGMIHLPLKREKTKLAVSIDAPAKIEANKKIRAKILLGADDPLPRNTKVVAALVDVGILNITRFKTPDAGAYFFAPRRYNIDLFDNWAKVIDNLGPESAFQRFGGGFKEAMADLIRGGDKPKSDVMMVSFFSDPLTPDKNNVVTAEFNLPNFNGKLRWMVLAFSDDQYGSADMDTTVADKIITQLSMPRFLARGDQSTIALDLRNMSEEPQELAVTLTLEGGLAAGQVKKEVALCDREKIILKYPVKAISGREQGIIRLNVTNENKNIQISRNWKLGVRSPYPFATRSVSGVILKNEPWKAELETKDLIPETIQYRMNLSDKPPLDYSGHFEHLLQYPYGCVEQTISSGYPWVITTLDAATATGLERQIQDHFKTEYTENFRIEQINKAVDSILKRQKTNGGFGTWSAKSPEHKWLTVYAAQFLNDAKKTGASVPKEALDRLNRRISNFLRGVVTGRDEHYSDDPSHYDFAYKSFAGFVLSRTGMARLSDLRRLLSLYQGYTRDDGLSWIYLAAAFRNAGDEPNAMKCFENAKKEYKRDPKNYYGEYGSGIRDLAAIVALSSQYDFECGNLIFELANALKQRQWLSTQERTWLFKTALALTGTGKKSDPLQWTAVIHTGSPDTTINRDQPFCTLFDHQTFKSIKNIEAVSTTLYANISLTGERKAPPKPQSGEMTITRRFYDIQGRPLTLEVMKTGELAVVQLDITTSKRTPDGLVVDLLPAGLEIENQNMGLTAIDIDRIELEGKTIRQIKTGENILHEEFREDRYVAAIKIEQYQKASLFYLVRAVAPGVYTLPPSYVEDMYRPYRFGIGSTRPQIEIVD